MKNSLMLWIMGMVFLSANAFSNSLECVATDGNNGNPVKVFVKQLPYTGPVIPYVTVYQGYSIFVEYELPGYEENRARISIEADKGQGKKWTAQVFGVSENGLYQLWAPGLLVQCYFEAS